MDSSKLICVDSKLVQKEKEEREGREREAELLQQQALQVRFIVVDTTTTYVQWSYLWL